MKIRQTDSPFSYHLFLKTELEKARETGQISWKYHFNFLRNILEKTSTLRRLSKRWEELLPETDDGTC